MKPKASGRVERKAVSTPNAVKDELVRTMASLISVDENGRGYFEDGVNSEKHARFSENVWFLYSVLEEDHKVVSRWNTEKLAFDRPTSNLPGEELFDIFAALKTDNKLTFREFKVRFRQMIDEEAKKPETEYTTVYPLNTKLPVDAGQVLIEDPLKTFGKAVVKKGDTQNPFDFGFEITNYAEFVKEFPKFDAKFILISGEKASA
jgi:hypothetical protein